MEFYDALTPWNDESTKELLSQEGGWVRQFVTLQGKNDSLVTSISKPELSAQHIMKALLRSVLEKPEEEHVSSIVTGGLAAFTPEVEELIVEIGLKDVYEMTGKLAPVNIGEREEIRKEVRQHFKNIGLVTIERLF